jgi:hypothetical protein
MDFVRILKRTSVALNRSKNDFPIALQGFIRKLNRTSVALSRRQYDASISRYIHQTSVEYIPHPEQHAV